MNRLTDWIKRSVDGNQAKKAPTPQHIFQKPAAPKNEKKPAPGNQRFQDGGRKLRIIPIGGLDEVGKNCMAIEYGKDIIIIDMGLQFPDEDLYGVDYLIPDTAYLEQNKDKIRGIIITHGHLDHIGALRHTLPKLNFPQVFGTRLTIGFIEKSINEFKLGQKAKLKAISDESTLNLGCFQVTFFRINHSIPDCVGVIIKTPVGNIVHSGDFKFDFSPALGKPADFSKIAAAGHQGVVAAMIESTNALKSGPTISDKKIADTLQHIVEKAKGRLIIALFSSVLGRIAQIIDFAHKNDRKVFISGRSLVDNVEIATRLGYLHIPKDTLRQINSINSLPPHKVLILTTGSQGEEMSALSRMGLGSHNQIQIKPGDTVVLSSSPIPGNERAIAAISNNLVRLGAKIITHRDMDVHSSGHGNQEDLKLMYSLLKPKYLIPIHGEMYMRHAHRDLISALGMDERNIPILENGDIFEIDHQKNGRKSKSKVPANNVMIEGTGNGNIGLKVQSERQVMANSGIMLVLFRAYSHNQSLIADPSITTRGFIYMEDSQAVINEATQTAKKAYSDWLASDRKTDVKDIVKQSLERFLQKRIHKQPLVVPIIVKQ